MNEKTDPKEEPKPTKVEPTGGPVSSTPPGKTPTPVIKPDSRARNLGRQFVRWLLVALIFLLVGASLVYFLSYQPLAQRAAAQETRITELEGQVEELKELETTNTSLQETNTSLQEMMDTEKLHTAILAALADTLEARLALANENTADASLALTNTTQTLNTLKELLPASQQQRVVGMEERLELALSELEKDPYAAQSDLDVITTQLIQLENALFAQP